MMRKSLTIAAALALFHPGSARTDDRIQIVPCRLGTVDLSGKPTGAAVEAALRRAFPRAVFTLKPLRYPKMEKLTLREKGKVILTSTRLVGRSEGVELFSPRFEVGGVHPGDTVVSAEQRLGRASIDFMLPFDEWQLTFAEQGRYDWPNCSLNFHPSNSQRTHARIKSITIDTP